MQIPIFQPRENRPSLLAESWSPESLAFWACVCGVEEGQEGWGGGGGGGGGGRG